MKRYVPGIALLTDYEASWWKPDTLASLSLWAVLIPQSMAYAQLAGVPAVYGLYTAFAAMIGYALFGTSRVALYPFQDIINGTLRTPFCITGSLAMPDDILH